MIKKDIIKRLSSKTGMSTYEATTAVDAVLDILADAFRNGENIELRNFGTFKIIERKAKTGQNIKKKVAVIIPAHRTVKFEPSTTLKEAMNNLKHYGKTTICHDSRDTRPTHGRCNHQDCRTLS